MSEKFYVGLDLTSCKDNGKRQPITSVTLQVDSENTVNEFGVVGSGQSVGVYDPYLVLTRPQNMSGNHSGVAAAAVGNYVIFSGSTSYYGALSDEA